MIPEEKQIELQRHRDILLATIDYFISINAGSFVLDNEDHIRDHYNQQKLQVLKYFEQRSLDKLQKKLTTLTKSPENSVDLNFVSYIKEKTGYDIDIFENLRRRVDKILSQNEIHTNKEQNDIGNMLHHLIRTSASTDKIEELKSLLLDYFTKKQKRKNEYSEVVSRVENNGIETVTTHILNYPKPKHFKEVKVISPDGFRKLLIVQWSDGTYASTSIILQFANGASGAIYAVKGIHPNIAASWKDNYTICISTKTDYDTMSQHNEVRSFDDRISIHYVNIDSIEELQTIE